MSGATLDLQYLSPGSMSLREIPDSGLDNYILLHFPWNNALTSIPDSELDVYFTYPAIT